MATIFSAGTAPNPSHAPLWKPGKEYSMETSSPHEVMNRMLTGYWTTQALYVAAKLGIPDLLTHGPRSADDLAQATKVHAPSLYRLLRALASMGVFAEDGAARFSLTP